MELGMKGKVISLGRFLYHECYGLRGKHLPLIILSADKHWYVLSTKVSIDKLVCECVQLDMLSVGKYWYALPMKVSIDKQVW